MSILEEINGFIQQGRAKKIKELVENSYNIVIKSLTQKDRETLL